MKKYFLLSVVVVLSFSFSFAGDVDKIGFMLEFQKKLDLSKKQVNKLNQLRIQLEKDVINQHAQLEIMEVDLKELYRDKEDNLEKLKQKLTEKYQLKAKLEFSKLESEVQAIKVLSKEQKEKFGQLMKEMHHKQKMKVKEKHYNIKFMDKNGKVHHFEGTGDVDLEALKKKHGFEWKEKHGHGNLEEIHEMEFHDEHGNVTKKIEIKKETGEKKEKK
ncbi:hypothetical protein H8E88_17850 [candidate division KSB1 bacterium]|nr:hypothetical protein [candidate division KSB1 bacterium]